MTKGAGDHHGCRRRAAASIAVGLALAGCATSPRPPPPRATEPQGATVPGPPSGAPVAETTNGCGAPGWEAAAAANAVSAKGLAIDLFGREEIGWTAYGPAAAGLLATACAEDTPAFAKAVAAFQRAHGQGAAGVVDLPTLMLMKAAWQARRPFVGLRARGVCPDPPAPSELQLAPDAYVAGAKLVLVHHRALAAYAAMRRQARLDLAALRADDRLLTIFSGYRSPEYDAHRCAAAHDCGGATRATCSAHRTGLAIDVVLGAAPGFKVDDSADLNRAFQAHGPAYRWMATHAGRYGFVNYVFEPWHWEWTGSVSDASDPPLPP